MSDGPETPTAASAATGYTGAYFLYSSVPTGLGPAGWFTPVVIPQQPQASCVAPRPNLPEPDEWSSQGGLTSVMSTGISPPRTPRRWSQTRRAHGDHKSLATPVGEFPDGITSARTSLDSRRQRDERMQPLVVRDE
jgi:hypothetical protein